MAGILFWFCVGSVLYTYVGYPALLAVLARLRRPGSLPPRPLPRMTLLITAHREEACVAQKLENTLTLDYPPDKRQILVLVDGAEDRTAEIVKGFADRGVELDYNPARSGKMAAINRGMKRADGEIVVFSDANNSYSPNVLKELARPFADARVGMVAGAKAVVRGDGSLSEADGLYWKYESFIKEQESLVGCCTGVSGEVLAIRKSLFEAPPASIINDDFFMAMHVVRRGYRIAYAPKARSSERVSLTAQDEIGRRARIVAGRYQAIALAPSLLPWRNVLVVWQVLSHKFLRPLVPLGMIGALLANVAALVWPPPAGSAALPSLAWPFNGLFLGVQALFYGSALLGRVWDPGGPLGKVLYLPTFLVNSNLAAVIGLYRFLGRRQTPLWDRARRRTAGSHSAVPIAPASQDSSPGIGR